jgi:hypothetical protein
MTETVETPQFSPETEPMPVLQQLENRLRQRAVEGEVTHESITNEYGSVVATRQHFAVGIREEENPKNFFSWTDVVVTTGETIDDMGVVSYELTSDGEAGNSREGEIRWKAGDEHAVQRIVGVRGARDVEVNDAKLQKIFDKVDGIDNDDDILIVDLLRQKIVEEVVLERTSDPRVAYKYVLSKVVDLDPEQKD